MREASASVRTGSASRVDKLRRAKNLILKRSDLFPNLGEPSLALIIRDGALGDILDRRICNVVAKHSVICGDVFNANDAPQNRILRFARESNLPGTFDHEIIVR